MSQTRASQQGNDREHDKVVGVWGDFCLKTCPFKAILNVTCAKKHPLGDGRGGSKLGCLARSSDPCIVRVCQLNWWHRRALTQMPTWEPYPSTMEKWVHKGNQDPWYWGPHSLSGNDSLSEASHQLLLSIRTNRLSGRFPQPFVRFAIRIVCTMQKELFV